MIDTTFDFRTDAAGRDPDRWSPTLHRYHRLLWSKPLPNGAVFDLDDTTPGEYLHHRSGLGEFFLTSDSVIPTYSGYLATRHIMRQIPQSETEAFETLGYTIGGMMLFPSNKVDGHQTLNGARGFHRKIADRLDLTLESIRRHYRSEPSPLSKTLQRYSNFFALFGDFAGYIDYFLLQDLVTAGTEEVKFLMHFEDFTTPAVPTDLDTYKEYRSLTIDFLTARNRRIAQWAAGHLPTT
jgi:hypothetical protein